MVIRQLADIRDRRIRCRDTNRRARLTLSPWANLDSIWMWSQIVSDRRMVRPCFSSRIDSCIRQISMSALQSLLCWGANFIYLSIWHISVISILYRAAAAATLVSGQCPCKRSCLWGLHLGLWLTFLQHVVYFDKHPYFLEFPAIPANFGSVTDGWEWNARLCSAICTQNEPQWNPCRAATTKPIGIQHLRFPAIAAAYSTSGKAGQK